MALLEATEIGLFRANPYASPSNNIKLGDPNNSGTSGTDTIAAYDAVAATAFEGINYTGKDGVTNYLRFFDEECPGGAKLYKTLPASSSAADLQEAIHFVIKQHEVSPIVEVTVAGTVFTVVHKGAGTMVSLVVDGAAQASVRT